MTAVSTRFLSDEPIELDITPTTGFRGLGLKRDLAVLTKLDEILSLRADRGPSSATWLIGNSTGVRFDVRKPQVRLYFLRSAYDTDDQIDAARRALVAELNKLWPAEEDAA